MPLFGLWSYDYDPGWHGFYLSDADLQHAYWPVFKANHPELAEPYFKFFRDNVDVMKEDTERFYGWDAVKVPIQTYPGCRDIGGWFTVNFWPGVNAFVAHLFWWNYLCTLDEEFLENTA